MCHSRLLSCFLLLAVLLFSCQKESSQKISTIDFEGLTIPSAGYWNGSDGSASFSVGKMKFSNEFNPSWQTWAGFAYSQKQDVTTVGDKNQFSVYDAANAFNKFALFYPSYNGDLFASFGSNQEYIIQSIALCNDSYPALSMKNGDAFCKKFGGTSGTDPDWFKVTISGYSKGGLKVGSVDYYLADFRPADPAKDYILNKWSTVDLSSLGKINKITFSFSSSDTGTYGINTPVYVCLDDLKFIDEDIVL